MSEIIHQLLVFLLGWLTEEEEQLEEDPLYNDEGEWIVRDEY